MHADVPADLAAAYRAAVLPLAYGTFDHTAPGAFLYDLAKRAKATAGAPGSRQRQKRLMRELKGMQAEDNMMVAPAASVFVRSDEERLDVVGPPPPPTHTPTRPPTARCCSHTPHVYLMRTSRYIRHLMSTRCCSHTPHAHADSMSSCDTTKQLCPRSHAIPARAPLGAHPAAHPTMFMLSTNSAPPPCARMLLHPVNTFQPAPSQVRVVATDRVAFSSPAQRVRPHARAVILHARAVILHARLRMPRRTDLLARPRHGPLPVWPGTVGGCRPDCAVHRPICMQTALCAHCV